MNQKQADNLVKLIEYFESVPEDNVDLGTVGDIDAKSATFDRKSMTIKVQECGSTFCLAGHLPYALPDLYSENCDWRVTRDAVFITYDYPSCKGFPSDDGCDHHPILESFEKNFGISYDSVLLDMVSGGTHPYDHLHSDKEAVLKFLRDKLDENGYEIAEVSA